MLIFEADQHVRKCTPKCKPIALAFFSVSKYRVRHCKFSAYTRLNWPSPKTPCLVQEWGAKLANLYIYKPSYSQFYAPQIIKKATYCQQGSV